jgi:hypothetical protein
MPSFHGLGLALLAHIHSEDILKLLQRNYANELNLEKNKKVGLDLV